MRITWHTDIAVSRLYNNTCLQKWIWINSNNTFEEYVNIQKKKFIQICTLRKWKRLYCLMQIRVGTVSQ